VVNSLIARGQTDIYLTGSNGNLLSSEFAPLLAIRDSYPKYVCPLMIWPEVR